ncbi:2-oxoglutarate dehydrogenase complex dihydrolipoyllysine-residue succinyltransferase [Beggiatoa alba]|nr:2-oxoglutarate dehydrogenase complex dihydrolipoyllysine-residue succinyltransferase [Beggiatoa alba]
MLIEVKVPVLSESVADGTLMGWHKKIGEFVRRDENLIDLETDKVVLEIVAPGDGVVKEILKLNGTLVVSDEVIAIIDSEASATVFDNALISDAKPVLGQEKVDVDEMLLSPAARKLAIENNIDPARVTGTGKDKRVTKADIVHYLEARKGKGKRAEEKPVSPPPAELTQAPPIAIPVGARPEKRVPMSRLRSRIAERLKAAQNTAAILTTFNEVNMQPVMQLRKKYKELFEKQHGVRLGFMSFFTKAVTEALKQYPVLNASVDGADIVYHGYYDIGIAVGSPRGLVVPILRDVDQMSFADIEMGIADFGGRAKDGKLTLDDLTGGTFSITNGGTFGSMLSTPILNPPQSAILGMHNIQERAMVENGEVVVRPMMYVALSYDHRIIDGHEAVLFLVAIKNSLEDPARLLLEL